MPTSNITLRGKYLCLRCRYTIFVLNATINKFAYAILETDPAEGLAFVAADRGTTWQGALAEHVEPVGPEALHTDPTATSQGPIQAPGIKAGVPSRRPPRHRPATRGRGCFPAAG